MVLRKCDGFVRLAQAQLQQPGMPVVVTGLTASPQFNGRAGLVQGPAPRPGRLAVLLDGDTNPVLLRQADLVLLSDAVQVSSGERNFLLPMV